MHIIKQKYLDVKILFNNLQIIISKQDKSESCLSCHEKKPEEYSSG